MLLSPASIPLFTHLQWLCYLSFTTLSHWKFLLSSFLSVVLTDCLFYMQYLIWEAWSRCFSLDTWHLKSLFFLSAPSLTSCVSSSLLSATLTSSVLSTNATSSNIVFFFRALIKHYWINLCKGIIVRIFPIWWFSIDSCIWASAN